MSRKDIQKKQEEIELAQDLPVFAPAADIYEKEDAILVVCDMPGVDDKHVDVTLDNDELTLTGYQHIEEPEGYELLHRGYAEGIFRRSFTLTSEINREKIEAKITNGILRLTLPKAEEVQPRKISVSAG
ncbi:MAG: Hsp20/alpha crystallin family protein [Spartobacteria bacterium]|nr:Hsp20/alpha crystallin family protein [Spartobacteria bacterium]